ncbi:sperm acrosome membrane-associated protein 6 isoform X3 [Panthera tigris]|uniref:sperm acrosome membrane-associated protein 6 isoform X3 n=1 Tax=Panthera leo TaxID=9689 RepID=UPI001C6A5056|nr:sperm acrosome membrane-associated protein 6 isoform X3 [Panthera leo]XP_042826316.1 sperm acrosome membrane-associated protein 6 isoform X3 [Panthera tigris]
MELERGTDRTGRRDRPAACRCTDGLKSWIPESDRAPSWRSVRRHSAAPLRTSPTLKSVRRPATLLRGPGGLCPPPLLPDYDERSHLHDAFTQMTHSLQEIAAAQGSFNIAFPDAAEKMRKVIMKLKGAQACVPPCGFQDVARRFLCYGCYSKACNFPLDCPVQDLTVTRGQQAKFSCTVNFQLPKEEITYSWKFAGGGLRTQDQSYFRDIPRAQGYLARIRPVQPTHSGTFSCSILHDQRPVARLYFFLNVTSAPPRGEIELQVSFRKVLRWAPKETETLEPWRPSLGELLARPEALTPGNQCLLAALAAVASASATLMVWVFFRWYFKGN